jgi:hypothetical protein
VQQQRTKLFAKRSASGLAGTHDLHTTFSQLIYQPLHVGAFAGAVNTL